MKRINTFARYSFRLAMVFIYCLPLKGLWANADGLPAGIPAPSFGMEETAPPHPQAWPAAEAAGYYYIDNSHARATDSQNPYGYPDKPRLTIPEISYAAGSYIEIHGGPYRGGGQIIFTAEGTREQPIWFRGPDSLNRPLIRGEVIVKGRWLIMENLHFDQDGANIGIRPHNGSHAHHIALRYSLLEGSGTDVGFRSAVAVSGEAANRFYDILIVGNHIHYLGDHRPQADENDYHGVAPARNVDRVWILNNHIHHMGGDAVQVGVASIPDEERPTHIYISGNLFHDDHENAIDIKESDDVIVSGNRFYGYEDVAPAGGAAVVIHNHPRRVWIVNNIIHRSGIGIVSTGGEDVWYVGNLIYNIHARNDGSWEANSGYSAGAALHFRASSGGAVNNTLYDYDTGLQLTTAGPYTVENNIFAGRARTEGYDIRVANSDIANLTSHDHSLFQQMHLYWAGSVIDSVTALSGPQQGSHSRNAAPLLADTSAAHPLAPAEDSPAIDAGKAASVYARFESFYPGMSIRRDRNGMERPLGNGWDIGALEFATTVGLSPLDGGEQTASAAFIYPNPVRDVIRLHGGQPYQSYRLYDVRGRLIQASPAAGQQIRVASLAPGIYFLWIRIRDEVKHFRFLKR